MKRNYMNKPTLKRAAAATAGLLLSLSVNPIAQADGTETLDSPSIAIGSGSDIVAAGTGMVTQPGVISINVPAGATISQVLLYWEGQMFRDEVGDSEINIGGTDVTGVLIGGQSFFFKDAYSSAYRADITALNLIAPGGNTVNVSGLDFTRASNGAGIVVIYDEGGVTAEIDIRDGLDLAFVNFPEPRKDTIPQQFDFTPASTARSSSLALFFGSVAGTISGVDADRPSSIEVTTGGATLVFSNTLASSDGEEWDTLNLDITIPAGASSLTVQAYSRDDLSTDNLEASLSWIAAGLSVPPEQERGGEGCTPGYWKQRHHLGSWTGYGPGEDYDVVFGVVASFDKTLLEALWQGGGGEKALGRHAVAALLNTTSGASKRI